MDMAITSTMFPAQALWTFIDDMNVVLYPGVLSGSSLLATWCYQRRRATTSLHSSFPASGCPLLLGHQLANHNVAAIVGTNMSGQ
jgi:hypothetical protein